MPREVQSWAEKSHQLPGLSAPRSLAGQVWLRWPQGQQLMFARAFFLLVVVKLFHDVVMLIIMIIILKAVEMVPVVGGAMKIQL